MKIETLLIPALFLLFVIPLQLHAQMTNQLTPEQKAWLEKAYKYEKERLDYIFTLKVHLKKGGSSTAIY